MLKVEQNKEQNINIKLLPGVSILIQSVSAAKLLAKNAKALCLVQRVHVRDLFFPHLRQPPPSPPPQARLTLSMLIDLQQPLASLCIANKARKVKNNPFTFGNFRPLQDRIC